MEVELRAGPDGEMRLEPIEHQIASEPMPAETMPPPAPFLDTHRVSITCGQPLAVYQNGEYGKLCYFDMDVYCTVHGNGMEDSKTIKLLKRFAIDKEALGQETLTVYATPVPVLEDQQAQADRTAEQAAWLKRMRRAAGLY